MVGNEGVEHVQHGRTKEAVARSYGAGVMRL